jgi:hypothetical protein
MARAKLGPSGARAQAQARWWLLGGELIKVQDEYKYLGVETGKSRGSWNTFLERIWRKTRKAMHLLMYHCGGSNGLRPSAAVSLWQTLIRPMGEHVCELWQGDTPSCWDRRLGLGAYGNVSSLGMRMGFAGLEVTKVGTQAPFLEQIMQCGSI